MLASTLVGASFPRDWSELLVEIRKFRKWNYSTSGSAQVMPRNVLHERETGGEVNGAENGRPLQPSSSAKLSVRVQRRSPLPVQSSQFFATLPTAKLPDVVEDKERCSVLGELPVRFGWYLRL
jgi:hypothetical protein